MSESKLYALCAELTEYLALLDEPPHELVNRAQAELAISPVVPTYTWLPSYRLVQRLMYESGFDISDPDDEMLFHRQICNAKLIMLDCPAEMAQLQFLLVYVAE